MCLHTVEQNYHDTVRILGVDPTKYAWKWVNHGKPQTVPKFAREMTWISTISGCLFLALGTLIFDPQDPMRATGSLDVDGPMAFSHWSHFFWAETFGKDWNQWLVGEWNYGYFCVICLGQCLFPCHFHVISSSGRRIPIHCIFDQYITPVITVGMDWNHQRASHFPWGYYRIICALVKTLCISHRSGSSSPYS